MSECYNNKHPLSHDGHSQADRSMASLLPSSVQVDGHRLQDILEFISKYAQQLIHHGTNGEQKDWSPFFETIVPVQIARISKFDLNNLQQRISNIFDKLSNDAKHTSLHLLLDEIVIIFQEIERWRKGLGTENDLGQTIQQLIISNLRHTLRTFIASFRAAQSTFHYQSTESFFSFLSTWKLNRADFLAIDTSILSKKGVEAQKLALENQLKDIVQTLYQAIQEIITVASQSLQDSLAASKSNRPHFGLLIAFLHLFEEQKEALNGLTQKHLDFFYKEILQLQERAAIPDQAHLIFELAKKIEPPAKIDKDTLFKDGKDVNGVEIQFGLEEEVILDKAQVVDLRTLFLNPTRNCEIGGLYIAPVANSADGQGEGFTTQAVPAWPTLGAKTYTLPADESLEENYEQAKLGVAFASEVLFLKEGKRIITLTLICIEKPNDLLNSDELFRVYLSGEKEWIIKDAVTAVSGNNIVIEIELSPDDDPIVAYDTEVLAAAAPFSTSFPVLQLMLREEATQSISDSNLDDNIDDSYVYTLYHHLKDLTIESCSLEVEVCGVRDIVVQNDIGVQDVNSAFMPFGPTPKAGSNFYVGSSEVFLKKWRELKINLEWDKSPDNISEIYRYYAEESDGDDILREKDKFSVASAELIDGNWGSTNFTTSVGLFGNENDDEIDFCDNGPSIQKWEFEHSSPASQSDDIGTPLTGFEDRITNGFIRFQLLQYNGADVIADKESEKETADDARDKEIDEQIERLRLAFNDPFLIDEYPKAIIRRSLAGDPNKIPSPPYIPTIKTFSLDYKACANTVEVVHLYPFEHNYLKFKEKEKGTYTVLPNFKEGECDIEGSLFIGIENLRPGGQLNLLFQIAEGSANPDLDKANLKWHYLADNIWHELVIDTDILSDETNGLIESGIVKFAIPWDINTENTILPNHLYWLRASAISRTEAIGKTITVHAQAALVSFRPQATNDLSRLSVPLEAEQISKPVNFIAPLKGITQPYASFGGRAKESSEQFYIRASERLRHKGRAITIFDYERLVLANFPEIYKVKCMPHTLGKRGETREHSLAPGYVSLIVIPDLANLQALDQYEPKVPLTTLEAVKEFLKKLSSPFVKIKVLNPTYESIDIEVDVKFGKRKSEEFYRKELAKGIRDFLTPWKSAGSSRLEFGGRIFKSTIINYIESQTYVDYLKNFKMRKKNIDSATTNADEISGSSIRSILNAGIPTINSISEQDQLARNLDIVFQNNKTMIGQVPIKKIN